MNYKEVYNDAVKNVPNVAQNEIFRFRDITQYPFTHLGRRFHDDVVKGNVPDVKCLEPDEHSSLYVKI